MAKKVTTTTTVTTTIEEGKKKTYVGLLLDESGSMQSCVQATVSNVNEQIQAIKKEQDATMDTVVNLTLFSSSVRQVYNQKPVAEVKEIQYPEDYSPDGMTAMYDAVGFVIQQFQSLPDAKDPDVAFLICIISDGQENSSRNFNRNRLAEMIQECQKTGRWTFTYLGANQDLSQIQKLNIEVGNIRSWDSTNNVTAMRTTQCSVTAQSAYFNSRKDGFTNVNNLYNK